MKQTTDEDSVRNYCLHHPLHRPVIHWPRIIGATLALELAVCIAAIISCRLFASSFFLCFEIGNWLLLLCFGKVILRTAVQVYQRYASVSTRRQCSCKPSCSEYALLALDKYIWPKALLKICRRVVHTCMQPGYHLDYP